MDPPRVYWLVTFLVRATLIVAATVAMLRGSWRTLFVIALAFCITFLPWLLRKRYAVVIPVEFELGIVVFVFASLFLGDVGGLYARFWWWDIILHGVSALAFGALGFLLVYLLAQGKRLVIGPVLLSVFSFSFALAIGALWEIAEFTIDGAFGTHMQKSGLVDTMWDLIVDAFGALVAATVGYLYARNDTPWFIDRALRWLAAKNPGLFR